MNLINYKGNLMKQNLIIILLAVVTTFLLVNLMQKRIPPAAHAAIGASEWQIACLEIKAHCFAINSAGDTYLLDAVWLGQDGPRVAGSSSMGNVKTFPVMSQGAPIRKRARP